MIQIPLHRHKQIILWPAGNIANGFGAGHDADRQGRTTPHCPNPLRIDVSKAELPKEGLKITGRPYFDGDDPKYVDERLADKLLNKVFRK